MNIQSDKMNQLEKLKKQKEILDARIQQAESKLKVKERKEDTRRKILIGAFMIEKLKKEERFDSMIKELDGFLTRNSDRKLFSMDYL
ncbi:MAG: hypothetical protein NTW22_01050 [Proteobacteria bacterium]|nr:hypothetical protein [Pseudomonadota bacterium]